MTGYMNRKSFKRTLKNGVVTMHSGKGNKVQKETDKEGEFLEVVNIRADCRGMSLLVSARVTGSVCHTGKDTCYGERNYPFGYLPEFERFVQKRKQKPAKSSLTSRIFERGMNQIAKKLGEEAFELVIEAKDADDELFKGEAADLLYYFVVMVVERGIPLDEVIEALKARRK